MAIWHLVMQLKQGGGRGGEGGNCLVKYPSLHQYKHRLLADFISVFNNNHIYSCNFSVKKKLFVSFE